MCIVKELEQLVSVERGFYMTFKYPNNIHFNYTWNSVSNIGSYSLSKTIYTGFILEAFAIKFIPFLTLFKQNKSSSVWSRIKILPCFFRDSLVKTSLLSATGTNWHNSVRVTKFFGLIKEMIIKIYFIICNSRTTCDKGGFFWFPS